MSLEYTINTGPDDVGGTIVVSNLGPYSTVSFYGNYITGTLTFDSLGTQSYAVATGYNLFAGAPVFTVEDDGLTVVSTSTITSMFHVSYSSNVLELTTVSLYPIFVPGNTANDPVTVTYTNNLPATLNGTPISTPTSFTLLPSSGANTITFEIPALSTNENQTITIYDFTSPSPLNPEIYVFQNFYDPPLLEQMSSITFPPVDDLGNGGSVSIPFLATRPQFVANAAFGAIVSSYSQQEDLTVGESAQLTSLTDIVNSGGFASKYHTVYSKVLEDALVKFTNGAVLGGSNVNFMGSYMTYAGAVDMGAIEAIPESGGKRNISALLTNTTVNGAVYHVGDSMSNYSLTSFSVFANSNEESAIWATEGGAFVLDSLSNLYIVSDNQEILSQAGNLLSTTEGLVAYVATLPTSSGPDLSANVAGLELSVTAVIQSYDVTMAAAMQRFRIIEQFISTFETYTEMQINGSVTQFAAALAALSYQPNASLTQYDVVQDFIDSTGGGVESDVGLSYLSNFSYTRA